MEKWERGAKAPCRSKLLHVRVSPQLAGCVSAAAWRMAPPAHHQSVAPRTLCPKPGANTPASSSPPCVSITLAALRSPCTTPVAQHKTDRQMQREASQQAAEHSTNTAY